MIWWRIFIVVAVAGGIWWAARPRYSLKIMVKRGDVKIHCGVPKARTAAIVEFLNGLSLQGKAAILGTHDRNGVLRIAVRGRVDPGTQQRIRNYLRSVL